MTHYDSCYWDVLLIRCISESFTIRNLQPAMEVNRRTLMKLRESVKVIFLPRIYDRLGRSPSRSVHEELSRFIEFFGDIAQQTLLDYWKHPELIDFSESTVAQMTSMIDEEMDKYPPIKCRCDEFLTKYLDSVTLSPTPSSIPTIPGELKDDNLHGISPWSTLFGLSSIILAISVDHLM